MHSSAPSAVAPTASCHRMQSMLPSMAIDAPSEWCQSTRVESCWNRRRHPAHVHGRSGGCALLCALAHAAPWVIMQEALHLERCTMALAPSELRRPTRAGALGRVTTSAAYGRLLMSVHCSVLWPTPPTGPSCKGIYMSASAEATRCPSGDIPLGVARCDQLRRAVRSSPVLSFAPEGAPSPLRCVPCTGSRRGARGTFAK